MGLYQRVKMATEPGGGRSGQKQEGMRQVGGFGNDQVEAINLQVQLFCT